MRSCFALAVLVLALGLGCSPPSGPQGTPVTTTRGLDAYCSAQVTGTGIVDVETDYVPHVVCCENGAASLEALKAQAVAARTFLYYKLNLSGAIGDGTSDQVYTCGREPGPEHYQAASETAGVVLTYEDEPICAFYVAGAIPSAADCVATDNDNDPTGTEHFVTYNWGLSGTATEQTTLGWVNEGNLYNRGCKSQNGADCLSDAGWGYQDILRFYYGMDIGFTQAVGACVTPGECTPGDEETQACPLCGVSRRTCDAQGTWSGWGVCEDQGVCEPDAEEVASCGCGEQRRTCTATCVWSDWGGCTGQGECEPGTEALSPCGDCGEQRRTCTEACTWGEPGPCEASDLLAPCTTDQPGACAVGEKRCVDSLIVCEPVTGPVAEVCDGLDNDCNGSVDEGFPTKLGSPPPLLAATVDVVSGPEQLEPGEPGAFSLAIRNLGTRDWAPGEVRLATPDRTGAAPSPLRVAGSWPEATVALDLAEGLAAGAEATLDLAVLAPTADGSAVTERFWLVTAGGAELPCPAPGFTLTVRADGEVDVVTPGPVEPGTNRVGGDCGCSATGSLPGSVALVLLALLWIRRRRRA